uniref:Nuclear receptor domain-containing protein n=1 Tax=Meloidogyne hapla TaxID=6305 RepID=A0A1I8BDZ3_MELHA
MENQLVQQNDSSYYFEIIKQLSTKSGVDPMEMLKIIQNNPKTIPLENQNNKYPKIAQNINENNEKLQKPKEEIYCDSGTETSSLSPGHTSPMTVTTSPHASLPGSRSNSFSVSSILRSDISSKNEKEIKPTNTKINNSDSSFQSTPNFIQIPQRVPFTQIHQQQQIPPHIHQQLNQPRQIFNNSHPFQLQHPYPFNQQIIPQRFQGLQNSSSDSFSSSNFSSSSSSSSTGCSAFTQLQPHNNPPNPSQLSFAQLQIKQKQFFNPPQPLIHPHFLNSLNSNPATAAAMIAILQHQHQQNLQVHLQQLGESCVVCGDRASGHHYGGFFRRSIQGGSIYGCNKNGQCIVERGTRNRCQKCRLEKCLRMGMQQTHVRLEKNRKRKSDIEQKEISLESMRQNMELTKEIVFAFKAVFLQTPNSQSTNKDNNSNAIFTLPLDIIPNLNVVNGRTLLSKFMDSIGIFRDLPQIDKEILLINRLSIVLTILEICSGRSTKKEFPNERIEQLKIIFCGNNNSTKSNRRPLSLEEAALLFCFALTADRSTSDAVEKIHIWLWKCAQEQISERNADDENIDPLEICVNLMSLLSDFNHNLE